MKVPAGRRLLPYIVLVLALFGGASIPQEVLSSKVHDLDTISFLKTQERHQDSIFNEAVQLLDSMKTSPTCNRVAATRLVASCQTFTDGKATESGDQDSLDLLRSTYAARLALCEIDGAGTTIPTSCLPVTVSAPQKSRFGFVNRRRGIDSSDEVPKEVLGQCLKTLESRPQWWTSYSNSRQNALIICQASRMETDKEELLDLHRSIAKSSLKLNDGLREALRDAAAQTEQQRIFLQAVQNMQEKVTSDIEVTGSLFKRSFDNFLREVEDGIFSFQQSVSVALKNVRAGAGDLEKDIQNASSQVGALQQALNDAHQDAMVRSQEMVLAQESSAVSSIDLASSLHSSLESLLDSDIERMYKGMNRFDASMEWLLSRMNMILEQENRMTERLQHMEAFIHQSQSKASELQMAQDRQTEALSAQSQAQDAIQFQAQVSQALLSKASASAATLQSTIDDATSVLKRSPGLSLGGYSTWSLCAVLLMVIAIQNVKVAIALFFLLLVHSVASVVWPFL